MTIVDKYPSGCKPIGQIAAGFVLKVLESERRFIVLMWLNPVGGHNAAADHRLRPDDFADPRLRFVFSYLLVCAERAVKPAMRHCLAIAAGQVVPLDELDRNWLYTLITDPDVKAGHIDEYAAEVSKLSRIRDGAARCYLQKLAALVVDEGCFEVIVREKRERRKTFVPRRLQKGRHVA